MRGNVDLLPGHHSTSSALLFWDIPEVFSADQPYCTASCGPDYPGMSNRHITAHCRMLPAIHDSGSRTLNCLVNRKFEDYIYDVETYKSFIPLEVHVQNSPPSS